MRKSVSTLLRRYTTAFSDKKEPFKFQLRKLKLTYNNLPWNKRATFKAELRRQLAA